MRSLTLRVPCIHIRTDCEISKPCFPLPRLVHHVPLLPAFHSLGLRKTSSDVRLGSPRPTLPRILQESIRTNPLRYNLELSFYNNPLCMDSSPSECATAKQMESTMESLQADDLDDCHPRDGVGVGC